jgi:MFS family permease
MIAVLRQRNFALLWFGGLVSMTGDWVLYIALPYHVYNLTGSALSTGLMFVVETLPSVLMGSVAGVFVDRWNRKHIMIVTNILQGLCLLSLFFVKSVEWLWVVYLVSFVESMISRFFYPAENALLPNLVSEKQLIVANSLNELNNNLAMLIGPAIGGALLGIWGLNSVILFDSASFFFAAIMIAFIAWYPLQRSSQGVFLENEEMEKKERLGLRSVLHEWLAGLQLLKTNRMVIAVFVSAGIANLGEAILVVLLIPFVNILHGGAILLGWMLTIRGLGGLLGGFVIGKVGDSLRPTIIYSLSLCIIGILGLIMYNIPVFYVALVCLFLIGIPAMGAGVGSLTLFQGNVIDPFRGRVWGAWITISSLVTILGQVGASILGDRVGIIPMLNIAGTLYVISGLVAFLMIARSVPDSVAHKK